jgi:hypothetical protein
MASKGGPQKEPKSEQPKPNEEQKEVANPGDPPKTEKKGGGD